MAGRFALGPSSGSNGNCSILRDAMLAASASISAGVCGTSRTFFGDFFGLSNRSPLR